MNFTTAEQSAPRLYRSELAVPGATPALFEKAARSAADVVFFDIETALGLANVEAIAQASRRAEAICFGAGDFAALTRAPIRWLISGITR